MDVAVAQSRRVSLSPFAVRRTPGQWVTDALLFALALVLWAYYGFVPGLFPAIPDWFLPIDRALGLLSALMIWWARSHPLLIGVLAIVPGSLAATASVGSLVAVHRLGSLVRPAVSVPIAIAHVAFALPYHAVLPLPDMPWLAWIILIPLLYAVVFGAGLLVRSRRLVIEGLRRMADAERERLQTELTQVRRSERERIAREMHDVLAHRISLLSVHAGALEYRTADGSRDLEPEAIHEAAALIRDTAHLAVEDLRSVLEVLRDEDARGDALATERRQPRLDDLPTLIDEARQAGQLVDLDNALEASTLLEGRQRTIYRIVQEALTNARKHASGARVRVSLCAQEGEIVVRASNPVAVGVTPSEIPGARSGLIGLAERVGIEGGTLDYGVRGSEFVVEARFPSPEGRSG